MYIYDENVAPKTERTSFLSTPRPVSDHQSYWHVHFYHFSPQIHARVSLSSAIRTQDDVYILIFVMRREDSEGTRHPDLVL